MNKGGFAVGNRVADNGVAIHKNLSMSASKVVGIEVLSAVGIPIFELLRHFFDWRASRNDLCMMTPP